jgi:hypothetical protein
MRSSVIGLTLAVAVVAQGTVAPAAATSAVVVAPAASMPMAPQMMGQPFNPYAARFQYGFGAGTAASPYAMRAPAPVVVAPAPVAKAVVEVTGNKETHVSDYTAWRLAYLEMKAKKSTAVFKSPLLQYNAASLPNIDTQMRDDLKLQYQKQYMKQNMQKTEYALNIAAQNNASPASLAALKNTYDMQNLAQVNLLVNSPVITYQMARSDYESGATAAAAALAACGNDEFKCRKAKLDGQAAQMGLFGALAPLTGIDADFGNVKLMVNYMRSSMSTKLAQEAFDKAADTYKNSPTASNMFALQIQELSLSSAEAGHMAQLTGFISPLAALLNGNYATALSYKQAQVAAKIADLKEKLAAETYKISQQKEPYGRTSNLASEQKTQRAFYNLLMSGPGPAN